jgi:flagellin-like protein
MRELLFDKMIMKGGIMMKKKMNLNRVSSSAGGFGKKGISAIVATVMIILITVAAVALVWSAILPMVKDNLEKGTACADASMALSLKSSGYTCWDGANMDLQVSLDSTTVVLSGIEVALITAGAGTNLDVVAGLPTSNEVKIISVVAAAQPDSVSIAPMIEIGGKSVNCEMTNPIPVVAC